MIGKKFKTKNSGICTIVEFTNSRLVKVRFDNGYETECQLSNLKNGNVKNPLYPTVYNVGYTGIGNFSCNSHKRLYHIWYEIIRRCYSKEFKHLFPTYIESTIDPSWLNFQNFCFDYLQMIGSDKNYQIDKDILVKRNKIYSKEKCCLVPQEINKLIIKRDCARGNYPIGVSLSRKKKNPFKASLNILGKSVYIGIFPTPELAFQAYKQAKESEIKRVAEKFKNNLDPRAYTALINYTVEIDD